MSKYEIVFDTGEPNAVSDVNGNFFFTNLGPGDYHVREIRPAGWAQDRRA